MAPAAPVNNLVAEGPLPAAAATPKPTPLTAHQPNPKVQARTEAQSGVSSGHSAHDTGSPGRFVHAAGCWIATGGCPTTEVGATHGTPSKYDSQRTLQSEEMRPVLRPYWRGRLSESDCWCRRRVPWRKSNGAFWSSRARRTHGSTALAGHRRSHVRLARRERTFAAAALSA
jgi:hypothetical protein